MQQVVQQQIEALQEVVEPYILDDTPDALTIGYRCQERGFGFWWKPYSDKPHLYLPGAEFVSEPVVADRNHRVELATENHCPYLIEEDWHVPPESLAEECESMYPSAVAITGDDEVRRIAVACLERHNLPLPAAAGSLSSSSSDTLARGRLHKKKKVMNGRSTLLAQSA